MTAEELRSAIIKSWHHDGLDATRNSVEMMEQYAKEQALNFFNWIHDNNRLSDVIEGKFTISDLYDQFKQQ